MARRNVVIADDSQFTIIIGFWGDDACQLELEVGVTILAIKNAQVSEYAGKSLNCNPNHTSKVFIDPSVEKAKDLMHWYVSLDDDTRNEFKALSRGVALDSVPANNEYDEKFLKGTEKPIPKDINEYMVKKDIEKPKETQADDEMNAQKTPEEKDKPKVVKAEDQAQKPKKKKRGRRRTNSQQADEGSERTSSS